MEFLEHIVALSALSVVLLQQILKLQVVPVAFANHYPVLTNILLSIVASAVAVWQTDQPKPLAWTDWVVLIASVSVLAAFTYNMTLKNWSQLRALEGPGKVE